MSLLQSSPPPPCRQAPEAAAVSWQTVLDVQFIGNSYTSERLLIGVADSSTAMHPRILLRKIRFRSLTKSQ